MTADGGDRSFGAPRFDVVLRGYDRRQVDEHLSRLQRVLSRMRSDLEAARSQASPPAPPPGPPGLRPRPTPRPRPDGTPGDGNDVVGTFTDRMQTILQAAEDEAAEIRGKARAEAERLASSQHTVRAEEEKARAALLHLVRQRDAVLADLARVRGQLEALLAGPTARISVPSQDAATAAAARRDAGAGHPLPGTPAEPGSDPAGPSGAGRPEGPQRAAEPAAAAPNAGAGPRVPTGPPPAAAATLLLAEPGTDQPASGRPDGDQPAAAPGSDASDETPEAEGAPAGTSPAEKTVRLSPAETQGGSPSEVADTDGNGDDQPVPDATSGSTAKADPEDTVKVGAVGRSTPPS